MRADIERATSNADFARRVGVHYTMASRIRNGHRMPSSGTLSAIQAAFKLDSDTTQSMMEAVGRGQAAFGEWVRSHLFVETTDIH